LIRLAVNADDFGWTRDVNDGIVVAHREGILTSTTLMANGKEFEHAVALARQNPTLDIGCHLTLVGGNALSGGPLPRSVTQLIVSLVKRRFDPYEELAAQVRRIVQAGIRPTHLDTHKHTHLLPAVLRAVVGVANEFGIMWVRRPFDYLSVIDVPLAVRAARLAMRTQAARFERMLAHCKTTDHFIGFELTGRLGPREMAQALEQLPDGFTEFMVHPGYCTDELRATATRLKETRVRELEALVSREVRHVIEQRGIELTGFNTAPV
jgi:predicted glycoside hydrolase/deacetylase ChbG (UPF0249 family)